MVHMDTASKLAIFAFAASLILLLGCAGQQPQQKKAETPAQPPQTVQTPPQQATESENLQKELDAMDAGVQESIDDLGQLQ